MLRLRGVISAAVLGLVCGCQSIFGPSDSDSRATTDPNMIGRALVIGAAHEVVERNARRYLVTTIYGTNTSGRPIRLMAGWYAFRLRAYDTPNRSGRPFWRSEDQRRGIPDALLSADIAPGQTRAFDHLKWIGDTPVEELLGDRPPGRYYFNVVLELIGPDGRVVLGPWYAGETNLP